VASLDPADAPTRADRCASLPSSAPTSDDQEGARVIRAALDKLRERGAEIIDVTIPSVDPANPAAAYRTSSSSRLDGFS